MKLTNPVSTRELYPNQLLLLTKSLTRFLSIWPLQRLPLHEVLKWSSTSPLTGRIVFFSLFRLNVSPLHYVYFLLMISIGHGSRVDKVFGRCRHGSPRRFVSKNIS